jgi:hypothetical protein
MRHHFRHPQAMFNKGSLFYSHCAVVVTKQLSEHYYLSHATFPFQSRSLPSPSFNMGSLFYSHCGNEHLPWLNCVKILLHYPRELKVPTQHLVLQSRNLSESTRVNKQSLIRAHCSIVTVPKLASKYENSKALLSAELSRSMSKTINTRLPLSNPQCLDPPNFRRHAPNWMWNRDSQKKFENKTRKIFWFFFWNFFLKFFMVKFFCQIFSWNRGA